MVTASSSCLSMVVCGGGSSGVVGFDSKKAIDCLICGFAICVLFFCLVLLSINQVYRYTVLIRDQEQWSSEKKGLRVVFVECVFVEETNYDQIEPLFAGRELLLSSAG
mmetsp:Transcript_29991/g.72764  ORF Transcript_29991/g.72764 Transcript_29991/m.72764 type:complete len:108 (+) Transcript_29991:2226-2549(+)